MNISASALTASRLRMDVVTENIANSSTTRTASGEAYRRKYVVYQTIDGGNTAGREDCFDKIFREAGGGFFRDYVNKADEATGGVRVVAIKEDQSEFKLEYDPNHPDADEDGYVRLPNVEVVQEMVDMMSAYRAYEANITAINAFKDMAVRTLDIGK
jgi:flagellar basal-body rod protein FlgC